MSNTTMYVNPNQAMFYENGYPENVASLFAVTGTSTRVEHLNILGFVDIVYEGTGFTIADGSLSGGTITAFTGYKDAAPHSIDFTTSGLNTPVSAWLSFAGSNNGLGLMKYIYSGDDLIGNDGNYCPSIIAGYGGNDTILGGTLTDTAEYMGNKSEYTIQKNSNGSYSVTDTISNRDGTDTLTNIERLKFLDQTVAFDINGNPVQITTGFATAPTITPATQQTVLSVAGANTNISGSGLDVINLSAQSSTLYNLTSNGSGSLNPYAGSFNLISAGSNNYVTGVIQVQFADKIMNVASTGSLSAQTALLYQAALNRAPEAAGLAYWDKTVSALPGATTLNVASGAAEGIISIASGFTGSIEFASKYGTSLTSTQFTTLLYSNVLDRAPDAGGLNYWVSQLDSGVSREQVLAGFAVSAEGASNATVGFVGLTGAHPAWLMLL